jgi:hypothetical protein
MHKGVSFLGGRKLKFTAALLSVLLVYETAAMPLAEAQQFESLWIQRRSALTPSAAPKSAAAIPSPRATDFEAPSNTVSIPARYGRVNEAWQPATPTSHPRVVLVQDIHNDATVQTNIAGVLDSVRNQNHPLVVGLEGAWTALDLTPYNNSSYDEWREMTARAFLERDYISGAHYFALTHTPQSVRLVGIENKDAYLNNLRARDRSKAQRDDMVSSLSFIEDRMDRIGRHLLPLPVQEYVKNKRRYEEGQLALTDYLRYLERAIGSSAIGVPPSVARFLHLEATRQNMSAQEISAAREGIRCATVHA